MLIILILVKVPCIAQIIPSDSVYMHIYAIKIYGAPIIIDIAEVQDTSAVITRYYMEHYKYQTIEQVSKEDLGFKNSFSYDTNGNIRFMNDDHIFFNSQNLHPNAQIFTMSKIFFHKNNTWKKKYLDSLSNTNLIKTYITGVNILHHLYASEYSTSCARKMINKLKKGKTIISVFAETEIAKLDSIIKKYKRKKGYKEKLSNHVVLCTFEYSDGHISAVAISTQKSNNAIVIDDFTQHYRYYIVSPTDVNYLKELFSLDTNKSTN